MKFTFLLLPVFSFSVTFLYAQKDTIPPTLKLIGNDTIPLAVNHQFYDPGISISDNKDTISSWDSSGTFYYLFPTGLANKLGTYSITYTATDKSSNSSSITRYIEVIDTIPAKVYLHGPHLLCAKTDSQYIDPGIIVEDNTMDSTDVVITIEGCKPLKNIPGIYKYRFHSVDRSGNHFYSAWRYWIIKLPSDTSPCILTDSLKDTCKKIISSSIQQVQKEIFNIYPNPASNQIHISTNESMIKSIEIYNISGQLIKKVPIPKPMFDFNISDLPQGLYCIKIGSFRKMISIIH